MACADVVEFLSPLTSESVNLNVLAPVLNLPAGNVNIQSIFPLASVVNVVVVPSAIVVLLDTFSPSKKAYTLVSGFILVAETEIALVLINGANATSIIFSPRLCVSVVAETFRPIPCPVSYTHLRAHETLRYLVCRLLLEKKK